MLALQARVLGLEPVRVEVQVLLTDWAVARAKGPCIEDGCGMAVGTVGESNLGEQVGRMAALETYKESSCTASLHVKGLDESLGVGAACSCVSTVDSQDGSEEPCANNAHYMVLAVVAKLHSGSSDFPAVEGACLVHTSRKNGCRRSLGCRSKIADEAYLEGRLGSRTLQQS